MPMSFYSRQLPTCDICKKPATHEILGSGNTRYGHTCKSHEKSRIKHLTDLYNKASEAPAAERSNS